MKLPITLRICLLAGSLQLLGCMTGTSPDPAPTPTLAVDKALPERKGYALAIGLNYFSKVAYGGEGRLKGCVYDATDMINIAKAQGFETAPLLLNEDATREKVETAIKKAQSKLKAGDTFVISYSGHGAQVYDTNDDEPKDHLDETWCLYDGQLVDDKLAQLWSGFQGGVKILVFSDSCFSGTVIKAFNADGSTNPLADPLTKALPEEMLTQLRDRPENLKLDADLPKEYISKGSTNAAVVLISACQDDQLARDGQRNGRFTEMLRKVWASGSFKGSLASFKNAVDDKMDDRRQNPDMDWTGVRDPAFEAQRPWTR